MRWDRWPLLFAAKSVATDLDDAESSTDLALDNIVMSQSIKTCDRS